MGADVTSELRGRISSTFGAYGEERDLLWSGLQIQKRDPVDGGDSIFGVLGAYEFPTLSLLWDLMNVKFGDPIDVAGKIFTIRMVHKENAITYSVDGYGKSTYKLPIKNKPPQFLFWSIGTISNDGNGSGTVYFSDVELLIDGECDTTRLSVKSTYPDNDQRKVPVNLEKIRVTFKEPMDPWRSSWNPPLIGPTDYQHPKTFVVYNQGENLEYNTWYEVCLSENGFFDLAGNGNRPYCFSFKTEKAPVIAE